ncbi:hypothetical protein [Verticiella alkaliphila]|uniref:hypothetical protein n=1 Tax=Verticiella alkaliphila TaxID=2779529 RepID=UPI001C0E461A|nr:hypothetical protein [Verticiella sp. GG226]
MAKATWIHAGIMALTALGASAVVSAAETRGAAGGASGVQMTPDGPKSGSNEPVWRREMPERKGEGMLDSVPREAGNTAGGNRDMGQAVEREQGGQTQRHSGAEARQDAKENADWAKKDQTPARPGREGAQDAPNTPPSPR